ncbi:MAG: phosphoribosylanthranilate isomerase [Anaerolineae bacterium]
MEYAIRNRQCEIHNRPDLLLDANHPTLYGGSGMRADGSLAAALSRQCRLLLAGGLTPDNVADAIRVARPWGVDVSSGVESVPGRKDHAKVRAFIAAARNVSS